MPARDDIKKITIIIDSMILTIKEGNSDIDSRSWPALGDDFSRLVAQSAVLKEVASSLNDRCNDLDIKDSFSSIITFTEEIDSEVAIHCLPIFASKRFDSLLPHWKKLSDKIHLIKKTFFNMRSELGEDRVVDGCTV